MFRKNASKNSPRARNAVFDIHSRGGSGWNRPRGTVSLRRHLYRRHPLLTSASVLALVVAAVLAADTFLGHANSVYWYPGSCLGGWTNPANAAGAPELSSLATADEFTADNSAILDNSISQIFCGDWSGDMPDDGKPLKVVLKMSWMFKDNDPHPEDALTENDAGPVGPTGDSEPGVTTTTVEDPEAPIEIAPEEPPADPVPASGPPPEDPPETLTTEPEEQVAPEPEIETEPQPEEEAPPTSLLRFVSRVLAQEAATSEVVTEAEPETEGEVLGSVARDQEDFLEIRYSIDGETWHTLGTVGGFEWQNAEFPIPIHSWDDLGNLQINIASLSVSDIEPMVYLDGMSIEVDYESSNPDALLEQEEAVEEELLPDDTELIYVPPQAKEDMPKERVFAKIITLDPAAEHGCTIEPFRVDVSGSTKEVVRVILRKGDHPRGETLEIGSLPAGIDALFLGNNSHAYQPKSNESEIEMEITRVSGSQAGDFSAMIVYTQGGAKDSSVACQINIVNL